MLEGRRTELQREPPKPGMTSVQVQVGCSLLTQRQHFLSLRMGLGLLIQQVGDLGPTAHV